MIPGGKLSHPAAFLRSSNFSCFSAKILLTYLKLNSFTGTSGLGGLFQTKSLSLKALVFSYCSVCEEAA